jgi:hypothetical protein
MYQVDTVSPRPTEFKEKFKVSAYQGYNTYRKNVDVLHAWSATETHNPSVREIEGITHVRRRRRTNEAPRIGFIDCTHIIDTMSVV